MSHDTTTNPSSISSSNGRSWLKRQISDGASGTPDSPHIHVVSIPDMNRTSVAQSSRMPTATVHCPSPSSPDASSAEPDASPRSAATIRSGLSSIKAVITRSLADKVKTDDILVASLVDRQHAVRLADRQDAEPENAGQSGLKGYLGTLETQRPEIEPLIDQILDRFPGVPSCVLLFAGSEKNSQVEFTTAQTAIALAEKVDGKILIVDSDFEDKNLSRWQDAEQSSGVCDFLTHNRNWRDSVCDTGHAKLDFMPVGKVVGVNVDTATAKLSKTVADLKSNYRVICVNVGDAHSMAAGIWSGHASGTYLVVSMTGSSQAIAKSAVSQLQLYGARLLGCIISDTPETQVTS